MCWEHIIIETYYVNVGIVMNSRANGGSRGLALMEGVLRDRDGPGGGGGGEEKGR